MSRLEDLCEVGCRYPMSRLEDLCEVGCRYPMSCLEGLCEVGCRSAHEESERVRRRAAVTANVYSFNGLLVFGLLFICICADRKKVPQLNKWLHRTLQRKRGIFYIFYKAEVIGTRLHVPVALSCLVMGVYVLFIN
ncbi:protein kish-B-like [Scyliorhinus canicula]|uniref:protein kish-B-like n=1 Tax=Scyliorhinus canicula TaxID=7830 RepID=UPI0018F37BC6|nr:protein kish-B-like [Scyliorhinus canicula]